MKALLIDDEALKGWKEILEIVLFDKQTIEYATDYNGAKEKLHNNTYDIIFLDLRLNEKDHSEIDINAITGFKILTNLIRDKFSNRNFVTPVIILTASNKIWNINKMLEFGADEYYIKEHPESANNLEFSRQNYIRLKSNVAQLLEKGKKKRDIWLMLIEIQNLAETKIINRNIRKRVQEKLKIGYAILFRDISQIESKLLLFNNEAVAFIVFWSILEEIVKDFFKDRWIKIGEYEGQMVEDEWVLRNGKHFIKNSLSTDGELYVGITKNGSNGYSATSHKIVDGDHRIKHYTGKIELSRQVYAVMLLEKEWSTRKANNAFKTLNDYRNKTDFIHGSTSSIFSRNLSTNYNVANSESNCIKMLNFIYDILS